MIKAIIYDKDGTLMRFDAFWVPIARSAIKLVLREFVDDENNSICDIEKEIESKIGIRGDTADPGGILCGGTYEQFADVVAETIVAANTSITVSAAGKDGLHAECDFDNKKGMTYDFTLESGFVALKNVTYTCTVKGDGIQADTFVFVDGGNNYITTEGEFVSYSAANMSEYGLTSDDFRYVRSGSKYKKTASDENGNFSSKYALVQSCKGIKVGEIDYDTDGDDEDDVTITENTNYAIVLQSGTYNIDSTDDSIHANGGNTYKTAAVTFSRLTVRPWRRSPFRAR